MENATKALIIAGSILISILLISIGVTLLNSTSEVVDQANNSSKNMAASMFNSRFTQYLGDSVSGIETKALVRNIITNNSIADNPYIYVTLNKKNGSYISAHSYDSTNTAQYYITQMPKILNGINSSSTYKIVITSNCASKNSPNGFDSNGYLRCLTITENP